MYIGKFQVFNTNWNLYGYTGFIQPAFVEKMLQAPDRGGFADRQLFDFPPERDVYLDELKVPVPPDVSKLLHIFKVIFVFCQ